MTATHKFPMPTVSFDLTTSGGLALNSGLPRRYVAPIAPVQPAYCCCGKVHGYLPICFEGHRTL
jgi:hypothetical protein